MDMYNQQVGYNADIIMCIDSTGSMKPYLDNVKVQAKTFYEEFVKKMEEANKQLAELRIKIIDFRDYGDTRAIEAGFAAMTESPFFVLGGENDETEAFSNYIQGVQHAYGGDIPENALEAIALAMKSDWTTGGTNRRHVIAVFTDAPALNLEDRAGCAGYPQGMPKDFAEFCDWWEGESTAYNSTFDKSKGRLVIFAPDAEPWTNFQALERTWYLPTVPGSGLDGVNNTEIMDTIVRSFDLPPEDLQ